MLWTFRACFDIVSAVDRSRRRDLALSAKVDTFLLEISSRDFFGLQHPPFFASLQQ